MGGGWDGDGLIAQDAGADAVHPERDYADVGFIFVGIDFKARWEEILNAGGRNRPVAEEQVVPALAQSPGAARERVGAMSSCGKDGGEIGLGGVGHARCSMLIGP